MVDAKTEGWIEIAQRGFENWKAKPHNARWFRKIDGTPIPNDLTICIGEAFAEPLRSLSLAGEDAAGLCERLEKRAAFWERYWTGRSLQDPDSGPIREAAALLRSLSLRVEAEKRAREEALEDAADKSDEIAMLRDSEARWIARIAVVRHATGDNGRMMLPEFTKWFNARWAELLAAETHSAALARALEEARDELLECKADYHRNPSSVIDKCNAVLAEARSLLAPKEDTDAE